MDSNQKKKLNSLQALRAMAFCGIFTQHSGLSQLGNWGVSVFFVLSGFVMVYAYYDKPLETSIPQCLRFSLKKVGRLYPLHILMLLAALFLAMVSLCQDFSMEQAAFDVIVTVLQLLLLQTWVPSNPVYFSLNYVSWYLSVCLVLYAFFPVMLKYLKTRKKKQVIALAVLVYALQVLVGFLSTGVALRDIWWLPMIYFDNFVKWMTYVCPLFRLGDFFIGCCGGWLFINRKQDLSPLKATAMEILTFGLIALCQFIYVNHIGYLGSEAFQNNMLFSPGALLLVALFAQGTGWIARILTVKPVMVIGDLSAYGFLIHTMVINYLGILFYDILVLPYNGYWFSAIAFSLTIAVAIAYQKASTAVSSFKAKKAAGAL